MNLAPLFLFSYPDNSTPENTAIGLRQHLSTATWEKDRQIFIDYKYSIRRYDSWTLQEWAEQEIKKVQAIDFSGHSDLSILSKRYLKELESIVAQTPRADKWSKPILCY
ncbi:MAG: hypothetical protein ACK5W1_11780, partial [Flavobacteriales bacterium]